MIIATVKTCPKRWREYWVLLKNFESLKLPMPLRTFQTPAAGDQPGVNSRLNARAALAYSEKHLPDAPSSWVLFLEDDVVLRPALRDTLDWLMEWGAKEKIDCWYLCNRRNQASRQFVQDGFAINELTSPVGSQALLIPKRHLKAMLATHWVGPSDRAIFKAIRGPSTRILQIVSPVLVEHRGEYSTFNPQHRTELDVNHADSSNPDPSAVQHHDYSLR